MGIVAVGGRECVEGVLRPPVATASPATRAVSMSVVMEKSGEQLLVRFHVSPRGCSLVSHVNHAVRPLSNVGKSRRCLRPSGAGFQGSTSLRQDISYFQRYIPSQ